MHWTSKYIKIKHEEMNCAEFVEFILRDHFKIDYSFPQSKGSVFEQSNLIKKSIPEFTVKTDTPKEGDLVLMNGVRSLCHIGLYVPLKLENFVFHTESRLISATLQNVKDLTSYGYSVEGFYTWLK